MSSSLDYYAGSRSKTLTEQTLDAFQDLLNKSQEQPEPEYSDLITGAYRGFTGKDDITEEQTKQYEDLLKSLGIMSPGEITAFVTEDLAFKPENFGYLPLNETAEKLSAFYGSPNVEDGKFTGTYGRGIDKIQGRPSY